MNRSVGLRVLLALAAVLLAAATWLCFDNPDIDGTSRGDDYTCLAPWDTVLNNADNFPGGEPPPDGEEIAVRCRQAGQERFVLAIITGLSAIAVGVVAAALSARRGIRTGV